MTEIWRRYEGDMNEWEYVAVQLLVEHGRAAGIDSFCRVSPAIYCVVYRALSAICRALYMNEIRMRIRCSETAGQQEKGRFIGLFPQYMVVI